jgi:hypothetical protein
MNGAHDPHRTLRNNSEEVWRIGLTREHLIAHAIGEKVGYLD